MDSLYYDLQNGISGDMAVAALLSLDDDLDYIREKLAKLNLSGYEIDYKRVQRNGVWGRTFNISSRNEREARSYRDIKTIIEESGLRSGEKTLSHNIFENLARAESRIHGVPLEEVHFHEMGAIDSIIDTVSFSILHEKHRWEKVLSSYISLGSGKTKSMHGTIPVPAPATLEILKGLPVVGTVHPYELTTPTGASIVKTVVKEFGPLPKCIIKNIGLGFGKRKQPGFNGLRVFEFEPIVEEPLPSSHTVTVIDVTIDDSTPEEIAFLQEEILSQGALDVYVTPIFMKKNRPAFNLSIVTRPEDFEKCSKTILLRSSSFGMRYQYYFRKTLERRIEKVETEYGNIAVKIGYLNGKVVKVSPEYEDCRRASLANNIPIREIFEKAKRSAKEKLGIP